MTQFHPLKVINTVKETADAKAITLEIPNSLSEKFSFKPGQYLTVKCTVKGEEVRRSYSLCSSPDLKGKLQIGVKRVQGGLVSNYLNDTLDRGSSIEVMPPNGRFYANVSPNNYKSYYLFAAGSGITPMLSILKTVLSTESKSFVYMIYGNKDQKSIMFKKDLDALQETYKDRFKLVHTLDMEPKSWSAKNEWFKRGMIDANAIEWFINQNPPGAQNAEYYICGPGTMIENTKRTLQDLDVPLSRISFESFGGAPVSSDIEPVANATLTAIINGATRQTTIAKGKTVLRALIDAGEEPPFSCEGGVCATCMCKVTKGKVHMKSNFTLSQEEINKGYALSCQSIPTTENVSITFSK